MNFHLFTLETNEQGDVLVATVAMCFYDPPHPDCPEHGEPPKDD